MIPLLDRPLAEPREIRRPTIDRGLFDRGSCRTKTGVSDHHLLAPVLGELDLCFRQATLAGHGNDLTFAEPGMDDPGPALDEQRLLRVGIIVFQVSSGLSPRLSLPAESLVVRRRQRSALP